jgi:DNA helicase-2/ATP-dependent DNA helicase PcrA
LNHVSPVEVLNELIQRIGYRAELQRLHKSPADVDPRWQAVEDVVNTLASYQQLASQATLAGFLDEVLLSQREDESDQESQLDRNAVALMTLHSAKGLEFPEVYLVGLEEGLLPHHRAVAQDGDSIDEERRLCYVGITRARDRLTMTLALSRRKWGKPRTTHPSRFLFELTGQAEKARATANKSHRRHSPQPQ